MLEALLDAGVDYPHGCTSGLCSLCKARLLSGTVEQLDSYPSALSEDERRAGLILPCRTHVLSACTITPVQQAAHLPPIVRLQARVAGVDSLTHDIIRLRLSPERGTPFDFLAGQYARLRFGAAPPRDFSMAGKPGSGPLEFFIRRVPGGRVTDTALGELVPGDLVHIEGPYGDAYLRESHIGPMLMVAGGSGIAPIRAIVASAIERGMTQPIKLVLGVRAPRDLFMVEELAQLAEQHANLSIAIVVAEGAPPIQPHVYLRRMLHGQDLSGWRSYVAGPPPMVAAVIGVLTDAGLPAGSCHADPFFTAADAQPV